MDECPHGNVLKLCIHDDAGGQGVTRAIKDNVKKYLASELQSVQSQESGVAGIQNHADALAQFAPMPTVELLMPASCSPPKAVLQPWKCYEQDTILWCIDQFCVNCPKTQGESWGHTHCACCADSIKSSSAKSMQRQNRHCSGDCFVVAQHCTCPHCFLVSSVSVCSNWASPD